jgi:D-3-phosphoglycerate dehydrogenase
MFNGREVVGGEAMTVYNLDDPVPDDAVAAIKADERIIDVREITLGNDVDATTHADD